MVFKHAILAITAAPVVLVAAAASSYPKWWAATPARSATTVSAPNQAAANTATETVKMQAELATMRAQVQLVRAQLAGLQDHVGNVEARQAEAQRPVDSAASDTPSTSAAARSPRTARDLDAIQARYMNLVDAEAADLPWASSEQDAIRAFVSRAAPDAQIEQLDCRTTMCRLRVRLPSEASLTNFRYQVGQPPLDHGGFFHIDPESHTLSYVSPRAGSALPDVED